MILWLLTLNVMVSGTVDLVNGHETLLPIPGPFILQKWHGFSAIVLFVYVLVHALRRRSRFPSPPPVRVFSRAAEAARSKGQS